MVFKSLRCWNCNKKVKKEFSYCPYCGVGLTQRKQQHKHNKHKHEPTTKKDKLPIEFKLAQKLAERILGKEFVQDLEKALREAMSISVDEQTAPKIHIKAIPIKLPENPTSENNHEPKRKHIKQIIEELKQKSKQVIEPKTKVRRFGDSVIYELSVPKAKKNRLIIHQDQDKVDIALPAKEKLYLKTIPLPLELKTYRFEGDNLIIEFKA